MHLEQKPNQKVTKHGYAQIPHTLATMLRINPLRSALCRRREIARKISVDTYNRLLEQRNPWLMSSLRNRVREIIQFLRRYAGPQTVELPQQQELTLSTLLAAPRNQPQRMVPHQRCAPRELLSHAAEQAAKSYAPPHATPVHAASVDRLGRDRT